MKFKKLTTLALSVLASVGIVHADWAFRDHRYSSLKATPSDNIEVMFVGNSITNMHEWWEAFGSQQAIAGRGNSGGITSEILNNLESYIDGKPKKLFLMIGTNDISTGGSLEKGRETVLNIRATLERIQLESPETEIYMQSILPRKNQNATLKYCNDLLAELCVELGVNYVDLTETMKNIPSDNMWSNDGLHPQTKGYSAWTHFIEDKVGYKSVYPMPDEITSYQGQGAGSDASRTAQFPYLPVNEGDILIFGDDLVHGGEWHELLGSPKAKDRGTHWSTGGINLVQGKDVIKATLKGRTTKPSAIVINYGEGGKVATNYGLLVEEAKTQAPGAKIICMSLPPRSEANDADKANADFNNNVVKTTAADKGVTYLDIYTPMAANRAKYIMQGSYVSGPGYALIAEKLAEVLNDPDLKPVTVADADALIARRDIRSIVGNKITEAIKFRENLSDEAKAVFQKDIAEAASKISNTMTRAQANAAAEKLEDAMYKITGSMLPSASTDEETHWYIIRSVRGNRVLTTENGKAVGVDSSPNPQFTFGHDVWKLIDREDGTYNIVNMLGEYINADDVENNTGMNATENVPAGGWDFDLSHVEPGTFVIFSDEAGNAQWNQSQNAPFPVLNWHPANTYPILSDEGSTFTFEEYFGELIEPLHTGWYRMAIETGNVPDAGKHIINADPEFKQSNTNFYALRYDQEQTEFPAKEFIHLTVSGSKHAFTGLNGHGIKENCTSDRQSVSDDNPAIALQESGFYTVGKWNTYTPPATPAANLPQSAPNPQGYTYVGKSSGSNNTFSLRPVDEETLAQYDIWTVDLTAVASTMVGTDVKVTLDNPANKGITTVFNGGKFFLTAGAEITPDQLSFTTLNSQELDDPFIHINSVDKIIQIDYTDPNPDIPVSSVELEDESIEMTVGDTKNVRVTVNPSDATVQDVTWTSSNPLVATVDEEGTVTAVAVGTAVITATCADQSAEMTVTVIEKGEVIPPTLTLDKTSISLEVGDTEKITATVEGSPATDEVPTWASSDEAVATVDSEGLVTAVAPGSAVITATYADLSATCDVTVTQTEDGILEISLSGKSQIYDLQGRKVNNPKAGLYIIENKITRL